MDEGKEPEEDLLGAFPRIFDRLAQIPGYIWDRSVEPFHSVRMSRSPGQRVSRTDSAALDVR